jgi:hypothetical protein
MEVMKLMNLEEAIEVLKVNKGIAETDLDFGYSNDGSKEFADAVGVVLGFIKNALVEAEDAED